MSIYNTKNTNNIPLFKAKHNFFCGNRMEQTGPKYSQFKKLEYLQENIFEFHTSSASTVFNCHNPKGVKLLTRSRLGLSHLREHKLKHSFQDSLNPTCSCGNDIETSALFLLYCPNYSNERSTFLNIIGSINRKILTRHDSQVTETVLYGDSNSNNIYN